MKFDVYFVDNSGDLPDLRVWVMQSPLRMSRFKRKSKEQLRTYRAVIVESAITPQVCVNVFKASPKHDSRMTTW